MEAITRILELAKSKGVSQTFICNKLGRANNYLLEIKKGKNHLTDDNIVIIADLLNTTPAYLKGETDIKEKPASAQADELDKEFSDLIAQLSPEQRELVKAQIKGILSNY